MKKSILAPFAVAGLLGLATLSATAGTLAYNFSTINAPTFNRPVAEQDYPLTPDQVILSDIATNVPYFAQSFRVSLAGAYDFSILAANFDTYIAIYTAFDPTHGAANVLAVNDDASSSVVGPSGLAGVTLNANTTYTFVITGFDNESFGAGSAVLSGLGAITAVPEPHETAILLAAGAVALIGLRRRRSAQS